MVSELKSGFSSALLELGQIQHGDSYLREEMEENRQSCQKKARRLETLVETLRVRRSYRAPGSSWLLLAPGSSWPLTPPGRWLLLAPGSPTSRGTHGVGGGAENGQHVAQEVERVGW